jgi:hypothetical protein
MFLRNFLGTRLSPCHGEDPRGVAVTIGKQLGHEGVDDVIVGEEVVQVHSSIQLDGKGDETSDAMI